MTLKTGKYTIVNPDKKQVIGAPPTKPTIRPLLAVGPLGSIQEPVFFLELLDEVDQFGVRLHRIRLDEQLVTADDQKVVVDAAIDPDQANVWIIESKDDGIYGLIQARVDKPIEPHAWTLAGDKAGEPVSLEFVPQTKSIPPHSLFKAEQLFRISPAEY